MLQCHSANYLFICVCMIPPTSKNSDEGRQARHYQNNVCKVGLGSVHLSQQVTSTVKSAT